MRNRRYPRESARGDIGDNIRYRLHIKRATLGDKPSLYLNYSRGSNKSIYYRSGNLALARDSYSRKHYYIRSYKESKRGIAATLL